MELIIPDRNETEARIVGLLQGMRTSLESTIASRRMVLDHLSKSSGMRFPERMIQDRSQSVDLLTERMMRAYGNALTLRERRLGEAVAKVHSLSPLAVLARGYALVRRDADGRVVRNVGDVSKGDITETLVGDGCLMSEIIEVKEGWN
jgi:exodeoxyribonuclease VII large subunit